MNDLKIKENRERGYNGFPLEYYFIDKTHPRYQMVFHWHLEFELVYVKEGVFILHIENESFKLTKGDCAVITGGLIHGGEAIDCVYECIVFSPELLRHREFLDDRFIKNIIHQNITIIPILKVENNNFDIATIINLLFRVAREENKNALMIMGAMKMLFGVIEKYHLFSENSFSIKHGNRRVDQIKEVLEYIETNYANPITLEKLSSIAGLSPKYFCAYFLEFTGRTPFDYINLVKIEKASLFLEENDQTILEIALSSGFSDSTYFSRIFKRYKGITPREYRKHYSI